MRSSDQSDKRARTPRAHGMSAPDIRRWGRCVTRATLRDARGDIVITFERDRESVGHVELTVPAEAPRWRTWGRTAMIRSAGEWTAVVKTADGRELARQSFGVTGA